MAVLKRLVLSGILGLLLAGSLAQAQVVVTVAPPAPRREVIPVAPGPRYVWEPGYYRWRHHRYYWVPGHYVASSRTDAPLGPGTLGPRGGGYVWVAGAGGATRNRRPTHSKIAERQDGDLRLDVILRLSFSLINGAKYPEMSRIICVTPAANASVLPSLLGTIAMFDVIAASTAFRVETVGWPCASGHNVR